MATEASTSLPSPMNSHRKNTFSVHSSSSETHRPILLRMLVILSLLGTCLLYGLGSYYLFQSRAVNQREGAFHSIAKQFKEFSLTSVSNLELALNSVAKLMGTMCPEDSQWPNCHISLHSFDNITSPVMEMANGLAIGFAPIVTPGELGAYENKTYEFYEQSGISELGISSFGKGIYTVINGVRYRVENTTLGYKSIFAPIMASADLESNSHLLMYDLHSIPHLADVLDNTIDCYETNGPESYCTRYTGIVFSNEDPTRKLPSLLGFHPIFPKRSESSIVGFSYFFFRWGKLLSLAVPSYIRGIDVILNSNHSEIYSFRISDGQVTYRGEGDLHDRKYSSLNYPFELVSSLGKVHYSITLYPTTEFLMDQGTVSPIITTIIALSTVLLTSIIFFLYDRLRNRDAHERTIIDNTKRLFVRFISHEIRTPLNTVHLGVKLFIQELSTLLNTLKHRSPHMTNVIGKLVDWIDLAQEIESSSDVSIVVLNDLINYDKISIEGLEITVTEMNMWLTTFKSVIPFNIQAKQSGVQLFLDLEISRPPNSLDPKRFEQLQKLCVYGDEGKLSQVVRNLLSNALKFTPSGGKVTVTLYWDGYSPSNEKDRNSRRMTRESTSLFHKVRLPAVHSSQSIMGNLVCVVQDNGHGISHENLVHLFKEGMQFHANQLQGGGGSGLGLWISKGIVEMHGGTLSAFSDGEGKGSTFTLTLPAYVTENPHLVSMNAEMTKLSSVQTDVSDDLLHLQILLSAAKMKKVLVVDDISSSRKIVCRLLRLAGCEVVEAVNGQDCIDKLNDLSIFPTPPDLILMDYEMPVMNGPTATRKLRNADCRILIIGLTGNVLQEDVKFFLQHGANAVLPKPLTVVRFIQCLLDLTKIQLDL